MGTEYQTPQSLLEAFGWPGFIACSLAFQAYLLVRTQRRGTKASWFFALLNNCFGALSVAPALVILFNHITGAIPGGLTWPEGVLMTLELLLGITAFLIAAAAGSSVWLAAVPCGVVSAAKIVHGLRQLADPFSYLPGSRWATPEYVVLAAHATLYAGVVMMLVGVAQVSLAMRMGCGVGGVLGLLYSAGMLILPWSLPIPWYWKIAAYFGLLWLTATIGGIARAGATGRPEAEAAQS